MTNDKDQDSLENIQSDLANHFSPNGSQSEENIGMANYFINRITAIVRQQVFEQLKHEELWPQPLDNGHDLLKHENPGCFYQPYGEFYEPPKTGMFPIKIGGRWYWSKGSER